VRKLADSLAIIETWMAVQSLWTYLDSVFTNPEIIRQLPQETRRFTNVDKSWIRVMQHVKDTPEVIQCCVGDDFLSQMLPHLLVQMEQCKKSLSGVNRNLICLSC
jgi:dynein heavy chain